MTQAFPCSRVLKASVSDRCMFLLQKNTEWQSFVGIIGLDLTDNCFVHVQLFVHLSRTTDPRNVTALSHNCDIVKTVVYNEVFLKYFCLHLLITKHIKSFN